MTIPATPELKGVANFRDFGLYSGSRGPMRRAVHFRSGHLSQATFGDLDQLSRLGLGWVVDLRRTNERESQPSPWGHGLSPAVVTNDLGLAAQAPHLAFLATVESMTPQAAQTYLRTAYRSWPYEARHVDLYRRWFQVLATAEPSQAVLVHCAAGKDRTGLIVALTQRLAGVHDDDILVDYLATNRQGRIDERLEKHLSRISIAFGKSLDLDTGRMLLTAREDYLAAAFSEMDARDGSPEAYVRDVLGVCDDLRDRVIERLLA